MFKKVDDEKKKKNYSMMGGDKAKAGTGGKDKPGGEPAKPSYDPKSKDFSDVLAKYNNDGKMGYGYVDPNTGVKVPWYIDMINGGGANAAGPEFVSPFEGMSGGLGGLAAQGVTNALNSANVAPYGYNRPRTYAQAGMQGYPSAAPGPSGGSPTVTPDAPVNPYAVGGGFDVTAPPAQTNPYSVGGGFDVTAPAQVTNPYAVGGGFDKTAPTASTAPQVAGPMMAGHNLPPIQGTGPSEDELRQRAIQTYGDLFLGLTPTSQQAIMRGIAQGMANAR